MKPKKVLFYIDSAAMLSHGTAVADILREKLSARIIIILPDSDRYRDQLSDEYEVHDYSILFRPQSAVAISSPLANTNTAGAFQGRRGQWARIVRSRFSTAYQVAKSCFGRPSGRYFALNAVKRQLGVVLNDRNAARIAQISVGAAAALALVVLAPVRALNRAATHYLARIGPLRRLRHWMQATNGIRRTLAELRPDVIVLSEDNIETFSRAFVAYGRAAGIPTVIVPYTLPNPAEAAHFYRDHTAHQVHGFTSRLVARCLPKWQFTYQGKQLLRLPLSKIAAIEATGLSTPAPWILNRGSATAIALDSNAQRDNYRILGFPLEQLRVVGDMNGEALARGLAQRVERRKALLEKLDFTDDRPLIVCAFPPDQYSGASTEGFEFGSFEEMVLGWVESFRELGQYANVVMRPHPRLNATIFDRFDVPYLRVTMEPTVDLVPLADLFVATISATIRWAIACGIPVVNYDCYRYRYGDYLSADGVVHVEELTAFRNALRRFTTETDYVEDLRRKQHRVKDHWGLIDDQCADRLADLIDKSIISRGRLSNRIETPRIAADGRAQASSQ